MTQAARQLVPVQAPKTRAAGPVPLDPRLLKLVTGGLPKGGWTEPTTEQLPKGGW